MGQEEISRIHDIIKDKEICLPRHMPSVEFSSVRFVSGIESGDLN